MKQSKTAIAMAVTAAVGVGAAPATQGATLADGFYDMIINNTPFNGGYDFGSDGAWNSSFSFNVIPGGSSQALYDDTIATPVSGQYGGNVADTVQGTVGIRVEGGVITGTGTFEFDTVLITAGGNFAEYFTSAVDWTGSIDGSGNINMTPTNILGATSAPALSGNPWNVNDFNGVTGTVPNDPSNNTTYDTFTTGQTAAFLAGATTASPINGAAYDGTTAILVKGGTVGSTWGSFFGAGYFEVWNVGFTNTGELPAAIPVPAAVWLFGSGLLGLVGVARRKKKG